MQEIALPNRLLIEITKRCNLRCKCCKSWMKKDAENELTTDQKSRILHDFAQWFAKENQSGSFADENFCVWFTGGEPFLKAEEVIRLAKDCYMNRLKCGLNTNGTLLSPIMHDILNSGLAYVEFSFDSHIEKIHDWLRGVKGTYERAKKSLEQMLAERKTAPAVHVRTVLGRWNLDNVDDMIRWTEELEVDGIVFQPLQCPFGEKVHEKWHEDFPYFPTEQQIKRGLATLLSMKKRKHHILNSTHEINSWYTYFRNPYILPSDFKPCKAMLQNIIVDTNGNVRFCYCKELNPIDKIGNLCKSTFDDIWKGENAATTRREMTLCRRSCGVMSCHKDAES